METQTLTLPQKCVVRLMDPIDSEPANVTIFISPLPPSDDPSDDHTNNYIVRMWADKPLHKKTLSNYLLGIIDWFSCEHEKTPECYSFEGGEERDFESTYEVVYLIKESI